MNIYYVKHKYEIYIFIYLFPRFLLVLFLELKDTHEKPFEIVMTLDALFFLLFFNVTFFILIFSVFQFGYILLMYLSFPAGSSVLMCPLRKSSILTLWFYFQHFTSSFHLSLNIRHPWTYILHLFYQIFNKFHNWFKVPTQ